MAYATRGDLGGFIAAAEFAMMAGDGAGGIDEARVTRSLADAAALIDRHLARRYRLPLTVTDDGLRRIACDLAWYYLHGAAVNEGAAAAINFKSALSQLKDLAEGRSVIPGAAPAALPASGGENPASWVAGPMFLDSRGF